MSDFSIHMKLKPDIAKQIEEWRRQQPEIPSRAEAVRLLLMQALDKASEEAPVAERIRGRA